MNRETKLKKSVYIKTMNEIGYRENDTVRIRRTIKTRAYLPITQQINATKFTLNGIPAHQNFGREKKS